MEKLLPYYERELVALRLYGREFAQRYPAIANKLDMEGEVCKDPHIERLIQACALLTSRVTKRLDDDYPQFAEALMNVSHPHYLRTHPSVSLAQVAPGAAQLTGMGAPGTIARGTELESVAVDGVRCKFRTAYDVTVAPLRLSGASFAAIIAAPAPVRLPPDAGAGISVVLEATSAKLDLDRLGLARLRVFIDGEASFCAALRDALFIGSARAYVEFDDGQWRALDAVPLAPAGFAEEDALIPYPARSHPAYRLLTEYFAFPEKFNFFDLDLEALLARAPQGCRRATLHLAVTGLRSDSNAARMLANLGPRNLLLGCTPVLNLFRQSGVPIALTHQAVDYTVLPDANRAAAFEVHTVDSVHLVRRSPRGEVVTEFRPFYSLRHGDGAGKSGHYWLTRRDEALAAHSPGHEVKIAFVDIDFQPLEEGNASVSLELTCSNRDLPGRLGFGLPRGDLTPVGGAGGEPFRMLRRPTPQRRFGAGQGLHWRLISHLSLNHHSLVQEGLDAFREMLTLYDLPQSPATQRQIGAVVGLAHTATTAWRRHPRGHTLVHGVEVRLTLDEDAFVGSGVHLFVQVIDHFLGLYVQVNSFTELVVLSHKTGEELIRCKPRNGDLNLV